MHECTLKMMHRVLHHEVDATVFPWQGLNTWHFQVNPGQLTEGRLELQLFFYQQTKPEIEMALRLWYLDQTRLDSTGIPGEKKIFFKKKKMFSFFRRNVVAYQMHSWQRGWVCIFPPGREYIMKHSGSLQDDLFHWGTKLPSRSGDSETAP